MISESSIWAPVKALHSDLYGVADASVIDPLADAVNDYDRAQITVAYVRDSQTKGRTLLLAVVELLTRWQESGPEVPSKKHDGTSYFRASAAVEANVRRVVLPVAEGLAWYRSFASGPTSMPVTSDERSRGEEPLPLDAGAISEEPPWPRLITGRSDDQSVDLPLVGFRPGGARTHHLLSSSPPSLAGWSDAERAEVRSWLRDRLHWDIFARPRLLGSLHLVVSNPLFRELHVRLAGDQKEDVVFLRVDPLPGRTTETLVATVEDIRPYGPALSCAVPLTTRSVEVRLGHEPNMVKVDVHCRRRGLLVSHGPFAFMRNLALNMGLVGGERIMNVPQREGRPTTYKVSTTRYEKKSLIGTVQRPDARLAAAQDLSEVLTARSASSVGQRVFMRSPGEAEAALRGIIGRAQQSVQIVDPYLGPTELLVFGLANGNLGVRVDILTSAEFLRDKRRPGLAAEMAAKLDELGGSPLINTVEVRVAMGQRSPIHDRFLVVDGRVWLVGSSLSELGSRGTVIVQLHDAEPVVALINQVWNEESKPLRDFVKERATEESSG